MGDSVTIGLAVIESTRQRWTRHSPAPDLIVLVELLALINSGAIERRALGDLCRDWGWPRRTLRRQITRWIEVSALRIPEDVETLPAWLTRLDPALGTCPQNAGQMPTKRTVGSETYQDLTAASAGQMPTECRASAQPVINGSPADAGQMPTKRPPIPEISQELTPASAGQMPGKRPDPASASRGPAFHFVDYSSNKVQIALSARIEGENSEGADEAIELLGVLSGLHVEAEKRKGNKPRRLRGERHLKHIRRALGKAKCTHPECFATPRKPSELIALVFRYAYLSPVGSPWVRHWRENPHYLTPQTLLTARSLERNIEAATDWELGGGNLAGAAADPDECLSILSTERSKRVSDGPPVVGGKERWRFPAHHEAICAAITAAGGWSRWWAASGFEARAMEKTFRATIEGGL